MRLALVVLSAVLLLYALAAGDVIALAIGAAAIAVIWTGYLAIGLWWRSRRG